MIEDYSRPSFGAFRAPRNLVFGRGQRASVPRFASALGNRALVVTDGRMAGESDFEALLGDLHTQGLTTRVFAGVRPELPDDCIAAGMKVANRFGADLIIGIGGGSCIDAAKAIATLTIHGGQLSDYYGELRIPGPVMPIIAVPTTAGTGSEVTPVAVVSDPNRLMKVGIASPHLIPHTAVCDPELTDGCPVELTAISGADALTHAVEALTAARHASGPGTVHDHVFVGQNVISDHYAIAAISNIVSSLETAVTQGDDTTARDRVMLGALYAGLAFGTAGTAAAHAVQYPVGTLTGTPHGAGVAVMLPYVMMFNRDHCTAALAAAGRAMGATLGDENDQADAAVERVRSLFRAIGIPADLRSLGLAASQLEQTAQQAMSAERLLKNNPRKLDIKSMTSLVEAAFYGDWSAIGEHRGHIGELVR